MIKRGASGAQYGDLCNGGAGGPLPLGASSDSPYQVGDILNVRRLGNRKGLEIGIGVAGQTVTIDKLLVSAAGGCVQDVTTLGAKQRYVLGGWSRGGLPRHHRLIAGSALRALRAPGKSSTPAAHSPFPPTPPDQ